MIRLRRMFVIILMALPMLANWVCASEDLSAGLTGDPRRTQGAGVKLLRHKNLVIYKYDNGSFWLILPFEGQNLFLKSGGLAFQFAREGKILARGHWDNTSGVVEGLNGVSSGILSDVRDASLLYGF